MTTPRTLGGLVLSALLATVGCSEDPGRSPGDAARADWGGAFDGALDQLPADSVADAFAGEASAPDLAPPQPDTRPTSSERLLFDKKGLKFTAGDKGFLPLIQPGDTLPVSNWSKPRDYYNGEMHIRYVISAPPKQAAGKLQTCIWTMGNADGDGKNYFPESCADQVAHKGVGTYLGQKLVPAKWWKHSGVPLVFAHPERFLIRAVLRGASGCNVTTYSVAGACWGEWPKYQNMTFRITIVMVAKGDTFSGWTSYP